MSNDIDNPVEDDQMTTRAIDTDARDEEERREAEEDERWVDDEVDGGGGGWDDEDPIAPRPRGRLLRPLPLALIAVAIAAAGFIGGVQAQKGSEGGGGSGSLPGGGDLSSIMAARGGGPSGSESSGGSESGAPTTGGAETAGGPTAGGAESGGGAETGGEGAPEGATVVPSFGAAEAAATGTVTAVEGHTIYVKESDGTVVAVKAGDGSTVTRESKVAAKKVHPGDSVVVQGSKHGSTVKASSIAATESGIESSVSFGGPSAVGGGNEGNGSGAETSVESLFE